MHRFAANHALMASKESRRVVKLYNRVAKALVEFEALWHAAWLKVRPRRGARCRLAAAAIGWQVCCDCSRLHSHGGRFQAAAACCPLTAYTNSLTRLLLHPLCAGHRCPEGGSVVAAAGAAYGLRAAAGQPGQGYYDPHTVSNSILFSAAVWLLERLTACSLLEPAPSWQRCPAAAAAPAAPGRSQALAPPSPDTPRPSGRACREAKYLQQMDVAVPESARLLLLQEDKFKFYFSQLSHVVRDYEAVLAKVCVRGAAAALVVSCVSYGQRHTAPGLVRHFPAVGCRQHTRSRQRSALINPLPRWGRAGAARVQAAAATPPGRHGAQGRARSVHPVVDQHEHRRLPAPLQAGKGPCLLPPSAQPACLQHPRARQLSLALQSQAAAGAQLKHSRPSHLGTPACRAWRGSRSSCAS